MRLILQVLFIVIIISAAPINAFSDDNITLTYTSAEWIPFSYRDATNTPRGLYIDLLDRVLTQELGITFEYIQLPWKRAQLYAEEGKADILITVKNSERLNYASASDIPLLQLYLNIFTYANHPLLSEIEQITSGKDIQKHNLVAVTNIGNAWHKENIDSFGVTTHYTDDEESAFMIVASKRADITIEPVYAGSYLVRQLGLSDKVVMTDAQFGPIDMHLLFSKKSPHIGLMPKINAAILKLKENGTFEKITERYRQIE